MARYTLELRTIYEDTNFNLFDFDYEFYDNALKSNFESKFFEHYYFDEIGFPTIQKFKHMLKAKLHLIMPYYKQLYNIEVQSINVDFLLQKDLKETFIREIENSSNMNGNISSNGNNNSENININSDTPQSKIDDIEKYMSNASKDKAINSYNDSNTSSTDTSSNGYEKTEFTSKGNIGVTSMATLVEKWREIIINIDEMILNDLQDLFMQVY